MSMMFLRLAGDLSRYEQRLRRKCVHTLEFIVVQGKAISYVSHEQMVKNLCQKKSFHGYHKQETDVHVCMYTLHSADAAVNSYTTELVL